MNVEKLELIEEGDKFSTENKLLNILGYPNASGNTRLSQLKEVRQYIDYQKTGKISRGKETNEIEIIKKYTSPNPKDDKRLSDAPKYLKPLILSIKRTKNNKPKSMGHKKLLLEELSIINSEDWKKFKGNTKVEFYKYYLLNDFKGKLKTALKQLYKENDNFYYSYDYMLINKTEDSYIIATKEQSEYINTMKENIKNRIVAKHKLDYPNEKKKTWQGLAYRYTSKLYKMLNDECKDAFGCDKCVEVITIDNRNNICETVMIEEKNKIKKYYKDKMQNWIDNQDKKKIEQDVIDFHNEIFKDVK